MKAENTTKIQFDSLSVNEAYARGAAAAFLARYDPTVPQRAAGVLATMNESNGWRDPSA